MRLAFISLMEGFPWGGSEELWHETALHALENNHNVLVLSKYWERPSEKINELINRGANVLFYHQPIKNKESFLKRFKDIVLKKQNIKTIKSKKWKLSLKNLKEFPPDVLIINQGGSFDLAKDQILCDFLKENKIPYFIICQYLSDVGNRLPDIIAEKSRDLMNNALEVYFVAERNKITAERLLAQTLPNARIVNNPVNIKSKNIVPYPSSANGINFACVARLDIAYKGQDSLLQVLSQKKWKERDWNLCFFGNGHDKELLENQIKYFGLEDKVKLGGHVSDISGIWERHHILILPSIGEGTPLALAEAMLSGRTAIVTAAGGNTELIKNNKNGFVAASPLPEYLDDAIECAWNKRAEWKALGENAFASAIERYKEKSGKALFELILAKSEILSKN
jgi:L-malate glycosyltransferase